MAKAKEKKRIVRTVADCEVGDIIATEEGLFSITAVTLQGGTWGRAFDLATRREVGEFAPLPSALKVLQLLSDQGRYLGKAPGGEVDPLQGR